MMRNRCKTAGREWCPLSGTRLDTGHPAPGYQIPCTKRLRRRSLLLILRTSQQPDGERGCQLSWEACRYSRSTNSDRRAAVQQHA